MSKTKAKPRLSDAELQAVSSASEPIFADQGFGTLHIEIRDGEIYRVETHVSHQFQKGSFAVSDCLPNTKGT